MSKTGQLKLLLALVVISLFAMSQANADFGTRAKDPGVRDEGVVGKEGAGGHLVGLTEDEVAMFEQGKEDFEEAEDVADGLGPRMNLDGCGGCHINPATGGTSPRINPQVAFATNANGVNQLPAFAIFAKVDPFGTQYNKPVGPIREVRFKFNKDGSRDGGVHNTATITGTDGRRQLLPAGGRHQRRVLGRGNAIFRIPTPVFGAGLIEQFLEGTLIANLAARTRRPRRISASAVGSTGTATTGPSPGSAGRLRTSRCRSSRAKPTTSRWGSPTSRSSRSVKRTRPARRRRSQRRHREHQNDSTPSTTSPTSSASWRRRPR